MTRTVPDAGSYAPVTQLDGEVLTLLRGIG